MNQPLWLGLLAEGAQFSDIGRNFRGGGGGLTPAYITFGLVVLFAFVVSLWLLSRWMKIRDEKGYNSPRALMKELCQAHGLDRADRRVLKSLAQFHRLDQPSRLFLEPDRFDADVPGVDRGRLERLRDRVFGIHLDLNKPPVPKA